jgi:hypothetical protein
VKGKFANETAERLYNDWNDGRYDGECCDGYRWYVLFVDEACILTECAQGFVDTLPFPENIIAEAWEAIAAECDALAATEEEMV